MTSSSLYHYPKAAALAVAVLAFPVAAMATPVTGSSVSVSGSNQITPGNYYSGDIEPVPYEGTANTPVSLSGSRTFTGVDGDNNPASMTFTYSGQAQTGSDGMKVSASASVSNGFYNPTQNDPYVIDTDFNTDPNGVPELLTINANSRMSDTIAVAGATDLSYVTFTLHIDGTLAGDASYVQLYQYATGSTAFQLLYNESGEGSYDLLVNSGNYNVNSGTISYNLWLTAVVDFTLDNGMDPFVSGSADFFNTVTFGTFTGYNANGQIVDLSSVTGSDGTSFQTTRVNGNPSDIPVPASLGFLGLGLIAAGLVRRRRSI